MDTELIDVVERGGLVGALLFFIVGGMREWWFFAAHVRALLAVWEARYEELKTDRDYWRNLAQQLLETASEGVRLAERRHDVSDK